MYAMKKADRSHSDRGLVVALATLFVVALIAAWGDGLAGRIRPNDAPASRESETSSSHAREVPSQPSLDGYEYLVTTERYVIRGQNGGTEIQERRRESWRTGDGWAWARQTGNDPGRFIFKPNTDWTRLRAARAEGPELKEVMRQAMTGVPPSKVDDAEFNFVVDLLGVETLPTGSLPKDYRRALVAVLASNDGVTVTPHVADPLGRDSIQVRLVGNEDRPGVMQSLFLDQEYRYLAYAAKDEGSSEQGSRIVTERRQVSRIPQDLLTRLGNERVEKALWD